jgi:hypothetical protein
MPWARAGLPPRRALSTSGARSRTPNPGAIHPATANQRPSNCRPRNATLGFASRQPCKARGVAGKNTKSHHYLISVI